MHVRVCVCGSVATRCTKQCGYCLQHSTLNSFSLTLLYSVVNVFQAFCQQVEVVPVGASEGHAEGAALGELSNPLFILADPACWAYGNTSPNYSWYCVVVEDMLLRPGGAAAPHDPVCV